MDQRQECRWHGRHAALGSATTDNNTASTHDHHAPTDNDTAATHDNTAPTHDDSAPAAPRRLARALRCRLALPDG